MTFSRDFALCRFISYASVNLLANKTKFERNISPGEVCDRNDETKQKRTKLPKIFFSSNVSLNDV